MISKSSQPKKRGRGRPATGVGTPVQVRLQDDALSALDDWRRRQSDLPGRAEAIRRLVDQALSTTPKTRKAK